MNLDNIGDSVQDSVRISVLSLSSVHWSIRVPVLVSVWERVWFFTQDSLRKRYESR
jgi:hypothetical protein